MDIDRFVDPLMVLFDEEIRTKKGPSHITDLITLTIKSLIPSEDYIRVNIDYKRYYEEIKLWKNYGHGKNKSLINILDNLDSNIYWKDKDDTIYPRIIPIILSNKEYSVIKDEVIKNVLFTTGNIESLIEALLLSKLFHCGRMDKDQIIEKMKEEVIKFSQSEFLEEYSQYLKVPVEKYSGKYSIEFERNKIQAINTLNLRFSNKFKTLKDCIEVILKDKDANTIIGKSIDAYRSDKPIRHYDCDNYYYELAKYVYKLSKGRIDPKALKIEEYHLPDIFKYEEGEVFYHSLLNKSKVIKREEKDNKTIIQLQTKSGKYNFVDN